MDKVILRTHLCPSHIFIQLYLSNKAAECWTSQTRYLTRDDPKQNQASFMFVTEIISHFLVLL